MIVPLSSKLFVSFMNISNEQFSLVWAQRYGHANFK